MVPDFTDDHRAATAASMSQQSNGHGPTTAHSAHHGKNGGDGTHGIYTTLFDARRWTSLIVTLVFFCINGIVVPVACLCTLFIFLYPLKLFRYFTC
jgi:hypothetical protein